MGNPSGARYAYTPPVQATAYGPDTSEMRFTDRTPDQNIGYNLRDANVEGNVDYIEQGQRRARTTPSGGSIAPDTGPTRG